MYYLYVLWILQYVVMFISAKYQVWIDVTTLRLYGHELWKV